MPRMAGDNQPSVADELLKLASLWEGGAITEAEYRVLREKVAPVLEEAPGSDPDWYLDPLGRFDYRWWDGTRWTRHVSWQGSVQEDPGSIGGRWFDVPGEPGVRRYWNGRHWTNRYRRNGGWMVALGVLVLVGVVLGVLTVAAWVLVFATESNPVSDADDIHRELTEAGLECRDWEVDSGPGGAIIDEWAHGTCVLPSGATLDVSTFDSEQSLKGRINNPIPRHAAPSYETGQEIGCPWLEGDRYAISTSGYVTPQSDARAQADKDMAVVFKALPGTKHPC